MPRAKNNEIRFQILCAANELFLEKGYDNVQMKEIAKTCGIAPTLLQHYFAKKEDILVHVVYNFIYYTADFLSQNQRLLEAENEAERANLFTGLYYRLLYSFLCKNDQRGLRMYTGVLFNAPLLQKGLRLSTEKILGIGSFSWDGKTIYNMQIGTYFLNGCLSQLVAIFYKDGILSVSHEDLVNRALQVYVREQRISSEEEARLFALLDERLTEEVYLNYNNFIEKNHRNYLILY